MIRPENDKTGKYSLNLYKYFKKHKLTKDNIKIYSKGEGELNSYNLFLSKGESETMMSGRRLSLIFSPNRSLYGVEVFEKKWYPYDVTEKFISEYERVGRCCTLSMVHKFIEKDDVRICEYCGRKEFKRAYMAYEWVNKDEVNK